LLTITGSSITLSFSETTGTLADSKIGLPILTLTVLTLSSSTFKTNVLIPDKVSTVIVVLSVILLSYTYFATQRMPLPHILPSEPSALYILILKSATSDGLITISPSEPIPKCLLLTISDNLFGSSIFVSKPLTYT